jgi:hypothetical protein
VGGVGWGGGGGGPRVLHRDSIWADFAHAVAKWGHHINPEGLLRILCLNHMIAMIKNAAMRRLPSKLLIAAVCNKLA